MSGREVGIGCELGVPRLPTGLAVLATLSPRLRGVRVWLPCLVLLADGYHLLCS